MYRVRYLRFVVIAGETHTPSKAVCRQAQSEGPWPRTTASRASRAPAVQGPRELAAASSQQRLHDVLDVQVADVGVRLPCAHKDDGLARGVNHIQGSANFLVNSVELGHDDSVDNSWILILNGKVDQRLVELGQLINRIITNKSFTNKQDSIWLIDMNQLSECSHQGLITLHSSGSVNKDNIIFLAFSFLQSLFGNNCWIIFVAFLIKRNVKTSSMSLKLLYSTRSEIITTSYHDS